MYNIGNYIPLATSGSRIAFSSFLNQSAHYADLVVYQKAFGIAPQNFTKVFITDRNATANSQDPSDAMVVATEANLDIQNMMAVANGLPMYEYLTAGKPPFVPDLEMTTDAENSNEPYVPFYQYLLNQEDAALPQVISNSYGEPEQTVPRAYAERTCDMIAQLTARGITIFESSGDTGIGSYCLSNDGQKRPKFLAEFPSSCPWLTAVGGTESVSPEIAWRDSSGGFSDYFQRPDFQEDAVSTYFNRYYPADLKTSWASYFNQRGRGFPDISAHSLFPEYKVRNH
jgi:tripeptidyl-peptidase I